MTAQRADQSLEQPTRAWVEQVMGMPVSIQIRGPGVRPSDLWCGMGAIPQELSPSHTRGRVDQAATEQVEDAVQAAFTELRRVDAVFSTWKPDSQVSRLRRGELPLADCGADVREVAALCEVAREQTGGWFDATLAGPDGVRRFDPTGLVKGWSVQRCCARLSRALAERDVLVNAGGDVAAACRRSDTRDWSVGIENPLARSRMVASLKLRDGGVATSGTAARGAHILSPVTGLPVTSLASVSVIGPSLMWADVYATAAFAQGPGCTDWLATLAGYTWVVVTPDGRVTAG